MRFECSMRNYDGQVSLGVEAGCQDASCWWLPFITVHLGWWSFFLGWWPLDIDFIMEADDWLDPDS